MRFIKYLTVMLVAVLAFQPLRADGDNYKEDLRKQPKTLRTRSERVRLQGDRMEGRLDRHGQGHAFQSFHGQHPQMRDCREGSRSRQTSQASQYRHPAPEWGGGLDGQLPSRAFRHRSRLSDTKYKCLRYRTFLRQKEEMTALD